MSKYQWTNAELIYAVCSYLYGEIADPVERGRALARELGVDYRWFQRWVSPTGNADPLPTHMRHMLCLVLENVPEEDG